MRRPATKLICFMLIFIFVTGILVSAPVINSASANNSTPARFVKLKQSNKAIWTGRSGGFLLRWGASEISASSAKTPTDIRFSATSLIRKDVETFKQTEPADEQADCTYERTLTVLSFVGSLVSLRDNYYLTCTDEAHPAGETRYTALDLAKPGEIAYNEEMKLDIAKPGKAVKLTDLFPEADIVAALLADPFVKKNMLNPEKKSTPKNLEEFLNSLSISNSEEVCLTIDDDWLTRFALHHIENGKVAVRLGFSGLGPCREKLTEIGLLLPIPPSLKSPLALAAAIKEGFLMQELRKIAGGKVTKMVYSTGKGARH